MSRTVVLGPPLGGKTVGVGRFDKRVPKRGTWYRAEYQDSSPWEQCRSPDLKAEAGGQDTQKLGWVDLEVRIDLNANPEPNHPVGNGDGSGLRWHQTCLGRGIK